MDPYEILGLKYPSTKEEIKARYIELARKHHPDKLAHLPLEERQAHEDLFKKINVAYELLKNQEFTNSSHTEWKGMWSYMEQFMSDPELFRNMGPLLKKVVDTAREYKKQKGSEHFIKVEVTLEEIHQRKDKKLRLFLKNIIEPVFIYIDCSRYPTHLYTHITPNGQTLFIHIEYVVKEHSIYCVDLFENNDLMVEVELSLLDYFRGTTRELLYLDNTTLHIDIPMWSNNIITLPNKGLNERGDLKIVPRIVLPDAETLLTWDLKKLEMLVEILDSQSKMM